jgi:hypothetical protein
MLALRKLKRGAACQHSISPLLPLTLSRALAAWLVEHRSNVSFLEGTPAGRMSGFGRLEPVVARNDTHWLVTTYSVEKLSARGRRKNRSAVESRKFH